MRGFFFNLTAVGALVGSDHALTILEGKAKGPRSGETTNESYDAASALAHLGTTYHPPRTINEGPFQGRLEFSLGLLWAENQTHETARPSGLPHEWVFLAQDNSPRTVSS